MRANLSPTFQPIIHWSNGDLLKAKLRPGRLARPIFMRHCETKRLLYSLAKIFYYFLVANYANPALYSENTGISSVTLSEAKGLACRNVGFFASLRMKSCVLR